MKKMISILLTLALLLSLAPAALAESIQIVETPEAEEGFWTGVGRFLDGVSEEVSGAVNEAGEALNQGLQAAREGLGELEAMAGEWFAESSEALRQYADEFAAWAGERFGGLWQDMKDTASGLWQRFLEGMAEVVAKVATLFAGEGDLQEILNELGPVTDFYTQEYAHAYAREAALTAVREHVALSPEEDRALNALNMYKAALDDAWEARMEAVEADAEVLGAWLASAGQDREAFEERVKDEAEGKTMRRVYGAVADVIRRRAGESGIQVPGDVEACLRDLSAFAEGRRGLEEDRRKEITDTLKQWFAEMSIDPAAYIDDLFAALIGG